MVLNLTNHYRFCDLPQHHIIPKHASRIHHELSDVSSNVIQSNISAFLVHNNTSTLARALSVNSAYHAVFTHVLLLTGSDFCSVLMVVPNAQQFWFKTPFMISFMWRCFSWEPGVTDTKIMLSYASPLNQVHFYSVVLVPVHLFSTF